MSEPRAVRAALAAVSGCTAAVLLYAILRAGQAAFGHEPDPALVVWSEHSGFFWRAWTAAYAAVMAGFATWLATARSAARVGRLLVSGIVLAALLLGAQGLLVP